MPPRKPPQHSSSLPPKQLPQGSIHPSTKPRSQQPPKNMAPFKARLDPSSKSALKVLLLGNELMDVNRTEGLALLDSANDILSRRHGRPLRRGLSLAERLGEVSERESDETYKLVLGKKVEVAASSSGIEPTAEGRSDTSSAMDHLSELLGSGSDEDVQSFVRKLREYLGFTPEVEDVVFDEIDVEDGELRYADFCQAQRVDTFDEQHYGHTYFCKGDIWERVGARSPYRTPEGELRKHSCDRCRKSLAGENVWVCGVGFCGILICEKCLREYECERAKQQ